MRIASICALAASCLLFVSASAAPPPAPATAEFLSARFAAEHHDLSKAADLFAAALDKDRGNPQLLSSAFFYAVAAGRVDTGVDYAKRLIAENPNQRVAYLCLAAAAMKRHDYRAARDQIARSRQDIVATYTVRLIDAWAAAGDGDRGAAQTILTELRHQSGTEAVATFNLALMADYFGDIASADTLYRGLMQGNATSPRLIEAYGRFLERAGKPDAARALYEANKADASIMPIATAGLARLALGRKPAPIVATPEDGAAEAFLGIATTIGDETGADVSVVFLQLAKYLRPDFELADLMIADRFELVGNYDGAIAIYARMSQTSPYWRISALQSATDKLMAKRDAEAIADLQALVARFPDDINVWMMLGDANRQVKAYGAAITAYTKAIALVGKPEKKNWSLYFARATAAQSAGDWNGAEADLKLALELNPEEPQILNFLGYSWVDQKENLSKAVAMLEKANRLAPNDGYITDSVGWAYYRLGRYRDAVDKLEQAALLVPGDATINDHLGDAYWAAGRKREAGFQWNHALAFGPEADEKAKIEKKLHDIPADE